MENITLRRATPEDASHLARLNAFVHAPHVEAHPHFFRDTDLAELTALYEASLAEPETAAVLAIDTTEDIPVGYLLTRYFDRPPTPLHHQRRYLEIDQIAVDPAHRRRGIAQALVARARDKARARGVTRIHLSTWTFNEGARAFFASEGFVPRFTAYWQELPPTD